MIKSLRVVQCFVLSLLFLSGCQTMSQEQGRDNHPIALGMNYSNQLTAFERANIVATIVQAEKIFRSKEEDNTSSKDISRELRVYWSPKMAQILSKEAQIDKTNEALKKNGLFDVKWKSIDDADPSTIRVTNFDGQSAYVEMVIPRVGDDMDNRLLYVLQKDKENRWKITSKSILDHWQR